MKNYSTKSTNKLLISFVCKAFVLTVVCILSFTFIASEIVFKTDVDLNSLSVISLFIVGLSSIIISYFSVYSIRNAGVFFGILSQIPLLFYMLINLIFHSSGIIFFLIKLCITILLGALGGILACEKSKKIKVK